jgi:pterin-4a-carbinolamine dehydratase
MPNSIFISYRRLDSQHATLAIADRLSWAFGADEVFFDRGSIRAGHQWPDALERGLNAAKVLVLIVGEAWLTATDKWARRRIDDPADWVRCEILTALAANEKGHTAIIPVLLDDAKRLHADAFDVALQPIARFEPMPLRADLWDEGLETLIARIAQESGLTRIQPRHDRNPNGSPARPRREQSNQKTMTDAEVRTALEPLARWQLQWGHHAWGAGGNAQEIVKSYDFPSFADVVAFMAAAAKEIDAWNPPHHPRWENQWKVLTVFFTTWDVDCRVTQLDIAAAENFDAIVARWKARSPRDG